MGCRVVSLPLAFAVALTVAALGTSARSQTPPGTWTQKAPMPAVRGEVAASPTLADGRAALEVALAAARSADSGAAVRLR